MQACLGACETHGASDQGQSTPNVRLGDDAAVHGAIVEGHPPDCSTWPFDAALGACPLVRRRG